MLKRGMVGAVIQIYPLVQQRFDSWMGSGLCGSEMCTDWSSRCSVDYSSLGNQVRERCRREWTMFQDRLDNAEKAYFEATPVTNASLRPHK
ncbi:hypothetical protein N665_0114s0091 [Sinapis alba]|nr:hypothetical protein N665_0114s0091 [Sinapis alba]